MTKTIYLPATGKRMTLGQYVAAWRIVNQNPDAEFKHGLNTWWPQKGRDIAKDFTAAVHDRINLRGQGKLLINQNQ